MVLSYWFSSLLVRGELSQLPEAGSLSATIHLDECPIDPWDDGKRQSGPRAGVDNARCRFAAGASQADSADEATVGAILANLSEDCKRK